MTPPREPDQDMKLVRDVFVETRDGFRITAMIGRFGDLVVFVWAPEVDEQNRPVVLWQGDNILAARRWVNNSKRRKGGG